MGWGEQGHFSNTKAIGNGFLEYKIDFGLDYRIYLGKDDDNLLITLGGGTREHQQRDIAAAKAYRQDDMELSVIVRHHPLLDCSPHTSNIRKKSEDFHYVRFLPFSNPSATHNHKSSTPMRPPLRYFTLFHVHLHD
jgi:hypothetical protein